jgi:putative transposase
MIDAQYMKAPFYGSRKMTRHLQDMGIIINRKRVQRLMRQMGIEAIYRKPRTSIPNKAHKIYPYLLRDLKIEKPNQVWCTDITYLPMARGFQYLVAIMDWASRKVLAWRISNTMETDFCNEALKAAIAKYGPPEIFNTDQGSQFTSESFTKILEDNKIKISMDGRGRYMDNIFIERLWRSVKYECVYLHAFTGGIALGAGLKDWFKWYNTERIHQTLDYLTPDQVYYLDIELDRQAA